MDLIQTILTPELWTHSLKVGTVLLMILLIVRATGFLQDDKSIRRILAVVLGLVIATALIGYPVIDTDGIFSVFTVVVIVMIVISLVSEVFTPVDKYIAKISRSIAKMTSGQFAYINLFLLALLMPILSLPFSYQYLYGFNYPPCGLDVSILQHNLSANEVVTIPSNSDFAYIKRNGPRQTHGEIFCAAVFADTIGEIRNSFLSEVYGLEEAKTHFYETHSPIKENEKFSVVSKVNVACKAHSCVGFKEGTYYVIKNTNNDLWVSSASSFDRLIQ